MRGWSWAIGAYLEGPAGGAEVVEELLRSRLVVVLPLLGQIVLVEDGLDRADRFTRTAVDALLGVDVEGAAHLRRCSRPGIPRRRRGP